ncbi:MAG: glycosyltransferase [Planctomycetaceae bacterium]
MPDVSILLPIKLPDPRLLAVALESVVNQSFEDWELLLLDASPGSEASDSLPYLTDRRIRHVRLHGAHSLTEQLNCGLEMSSCDIIARADADDVNESWRLETQLRWMQDHSEIAVLGTAITLIDDEGQAKRVRQYPQTPDSIRRRMRSFNAVAHPTVVMRREAVLSAGGYQFSGRPAQDYELWSRMIASGHNLANLPDATVRYRLHRGSVKSQRLRETLRSTLEVKETYWREEMTWSEQLRYQLERRLHHLPAALVQWLFLRLETQPVGSRMRPRCDNTTAATR